MQNFLQKLNSKKYKLNNILILMRNNYIPRRKSVKDQLREKAGFTIAVDESALAKGRKEIEDYMYQISDEINRKLALSSHYMKDIIIL